MNPSGASRHLSQSERQVGLQKTYLARLSGELAAASPLTGGEIRLAVSRRAEQSPAPTRSGEITY